MTRAMGTKNKQRARSSGGSDSDRAHSKEPARSLSKARIREAVRAAIVGQVGESPTPAELAAAQARAKAAIAAASSSTVPLHAHGAGGSAASAHPEVLSVAAAKAGATMAGPKAPADEADKPVKAAPVAAWVSGLTSPPAHVAPGKGPPPGTHLQAPVTPPKRMAAVPVSLPKPQAVPVAQQSVPETPAPAPASRPAVSYGPPSPVATTAPDTLNPKP